MSASRDYPFERWPGYNEQSWSERFDELDRINRQRHEQQMVLIKQIGDHMRKNAETLAQVPAAIAEARRQALEEAAKVADDNRTDDDSMWDRAAQTIAQAIRDMKDRT